MKTKAYILLIVELLLTVVVSGQQNYMLEINVKTNAIESDIPDYNTQFTDSIARDFEIRRFITDLQSVGFADLKLDSSRYNSEKMMVYITLGDRYIWQQLEFNTTEWKMLQNLNRKSQEFNNHDFNYKELQALQKEIIIRFENSGYPFASTYLDNIIIDNNKISAKLVIEKNRFIKIDTIQLTDFKNISLGYIQQYLGVKIGEEYNESRISDIEKLIGSLDFINIDKAVSIDFVNDKASVLLSLKQKQNNQFNGIMGMAPNSQTKKLQFTGNLNLKLVNSFARGERISLSWESPGNSSQFLEIKLQYPYLFNTPFGVGLDFKIDKQDTTYVNMETKPSLQFAMRGQDYISTYANIFQSNYLNSENILNANLRDVSSQTFGFGVYINRLDNVFNPRRGYLLNINTDGGYKHISANGDNTLEGIDELLFRGKSEIQAFIPLFARQTIKISNSTAFIEGENLMINELYKIGGFKTFRGFDEQSLFAQYYNISTIEYRLLLDQFSYIGAFYNFGKIVNPYEITPTGIYQSFGLSFNFATKAGVFGLSYAIGKYEETNFEFGKAKIHFGYMAVF